jgi:hypothetical protein
MWESIRIKDRLDLSSLVIYRNCLNEQSTVIRKIERFQLIPTNLRSLRERNSDCHPDRR